MTDYLRDEHDEPHDDAEKGTSRSSDNSPNRSTYYPRKARDPLVLMLAMLLFAMLAIAGIVVAVTGNHKDPTGIVLPVHVAKSLDQDQPRANAASLSDEVIPAEEMSGDMVLDRDELPASKMEDLEQREAPLDLSPMSPVPEFSPQGMQLYRSMEQHKSVTASADLSAGKMSVAAIPEKKTSQA